MLQQIHLHQQMLGDHLVEAQVRQALVQLGQVRGIITSTVRPLVNIVDWLS